MYNAVAENLQEMILNSRMYYQEALDRDMKFNGWPFVIFSLSSGREIIIFAMLTAGFLQTII